MTVRSLVAAFSIKITKAELFLKGFKNQMKRILTMNSLPYGDIMPCV